MPAPAVKPRVGTTKVVLISVTEASPPPAVCAAEDRWFGSGPVALEWGQHCLMTGVAVVPSLMLGGVSALHPARKFKRGETVLRTTSQSWKRGKPSVDAATAAVWQVQVKTKKGSEESKTRWQSSVAFSREEPWGLIHIVEDQSVQEAEKEMRLPLNVLAVEVECRLDRVMRASALTCCRSLVTSKHS